MTGYHSTLNLPRTAFPMKADLPRREPEIQRFWEERGLYDAVCRWRAGRPTFVLHDGPPYANGDIHLGTALNKVLKDFVVKFATMDGHDSPYVPGWDTHGLPIELQAIRAVGIDRHRISPLEVRRHCREYALKYLDVQREQFKRLGVRGDWEHPYMTLDPSFEARQVEVFGEMARRGHIYKGLKPVYWCASCETALAEAEVEYRDKRSHSIYVSFPVQDGRGLLPPGSAVLIWTTTPWTLPANTGIAVRPDAAYVLADTDRGVFLVARELVETVAEELGLQVRGEAGRFRGTDLEGVTCRHPFFERESRIVLGDHVTLEDGTGAVHTSPGHGQEDFEVGVRSGLPVINPVDGRGVFTREAGKFEGMFVEDANEAILEELRDRGRLLGSGHLVHQYPHCWRCKEPLLFRATEQWFASVEGFREDALKAIDQVRWIPASGRDRIFNMVAERGDWCISRQRAWGVPIPVFYCDQCGKTVVDEVSIASVRDLFLREGSDATRSCPPVTGAGPAGGNGSARRAI